MLLWLCFPIQAVDWGGSSTFFATVESDDDLDWFSEGLLALWLNAPLGPSYSMVSQGSFRATTDPLYVADLDLLYLEGLSAVGERLAVGTRAGRFLLDEFSGLVFEHRGDGVEIWLSSRPAVTRIGAVYTGLLLKPNSAVVMSKLDEIDDRDDDVRLAPRRLVAIGEVQFVEPLPRTDVTLAVVVQQDLRDSADLIEEGETVLDETSGGLLDTRYALLGVNGALGTRWFYALSGGVQFGRVLAYVPDAESATGARYAYADIRSYAGSIGLEHYVPGPRAGRWGHCIPVAILIPVRSGREDAATR
ncbi:MAG: hypothetical protein EA404_09115 [Spirochaetaceae bacterium]|nr:MAG: hypothetical protein EA404_09115 [Spirochaetaceae bacterium]